MATAVELIKGATEAVLGIGEISIDNFTFKLFYKWSVSIFIAGSVAVVSNQFFGDPLACETVRKEKNIFQWFDTFYKADDSVDEEALTAYCWMYSTFELPGDYKVKKFFCLIGS